MVWTPLKWVAALKAKPFFSRQHAVHPALFFGVGWIQGGQRLGEPPEALVATRAVFDEKPFQCFAATGGEQNHALVNAVEDGLAVAFDFRFAERRPAFVGLFEHFEQVELRHLLFSGRRDFAFVLAEQMAGAFADGQQTGLIAGNFHEAAQIFQVCAESLRDFARGVILKAET